MVRESATRPGLFLPDYKGGSIVNLMSSIRRSFGQRTSYAPLRLLAPKELTGKSVLFIMIDGMGYEFLKRYGRDTLLWKHCRGHITSIFPSTTAAAVTTFSTGVAPQQHAITGWFVHLKEAGMVSAVLRHTARIGGGPVAIPRNVVFSTPSFYSMTVHTVTHEKIASTMQNSKKHRVHSYNSLRGFREQTVRAVRAPKRKFIYSYWPELDMKMHEKGYAHPAVRAHLRELDNALAQLLRAIKGTATTIVITADHGHMSTKPAHVICLEKHKPLWDALVLPPSGEPRATYCYVRPAKVAQFERYVTTKLKNSCTLIKGSDAIARGWYGLGRANPKLFDRVGDYILLMKKDYITADLRHGKPDYFIGNHGGLSSAEMLVPLIVITP